MHSSVINGQVRDWSWKRLSDGHTLQAFYIGDDYVGQVGQIGKTWTAIFKTPELAARYGSVHGFRTRLDASLFLIQFEGEPTT